MFPRLWLCSPRFPVHSPFSNAAAGARHGKQRGPVTALKKGTA